MKLKKITNRALWIGAALGLLNVAVTNIHLADRPIGASTSYPYVAGLLFDLQNSIYFKSIATAGSWEMWFVLGGFIGSLCIAIYTKRFKMNIVPALWAQYKGKSSIKRLLYAFLGGLRFNTGRSHRRWLCKWTYFIWQYGNGCEQFCFYDLCGSIVFCFHQIFL